MFQGNMKFLFQKLLFQSPLVILCCLAISTFSLQHGGAVSLPKNETVPAVIVFGDSVVDPGNNNYINTIVKCNFPPYGREFGGGNQPTGRFNNGLAPSDIIASKFGVKKLMPAYLDPNLQLQDLLTGVSFGSGGAGYDPLTSEIAELYGLGARRIGVIGMPVIGCVPSQRTTGGGIERACSDLENQAASLFNTKLVSQMDDLRKKFPETKLVYLDIYYSLLYIIQNPAKFGFEVADRGCCGTGYIEVSILCNPYSLDTCSNSSSYIFWDSYHPTEEAYNVLCSMVLDDKIKDFF